MTRRSNAHDGPTPTQPGAQHHLPQQWKFGSPCSPTDWPGHQHIDSAGLRSVPQCSAPSLGEACTDLFGSRRGRAVRGSADFGREEAALGAVSKAGEPYRAAEMRQSKLARDDVRGGSESGGGASAELHRGSMVFFIGLSQCILVRIYCIEQFDSSSVFRVSSCVPG